MEGYINNLKRCKKTMNEYLIDSYGTISNEYFQTKMVKKDFTISEVLGFKIFDSIKRHYLLKKINVILRKSALKELKHIMINEINSKYHKTQCLEQENPREDIIESLRQYVSDKVNFKKENFLLNPKYYPKSSQINVKELKDDLDDDIFDYISVRRKASNLGVSYFTLYNTITKTLGYSFKQSNPINNRRNLGLNKKFLEIYFLKKLSLMQNNSIFIYVDESSFNIHKRTRKRWVKKASFSYFYDSGRIKSCSLILGITNKKILGSYINKKSNKSNDFVSFMKIIVKKLKKDKKTKEDYEKGRYCIILDNASIHKSKLVTEYLNSSSLSVLYFAPYHPENNPVEYAFRLMKGKFYRRNISHQ